MNRRRPGVVLALVALLAVVLGTAAPAAGHADLAGSTPVPGSVVDEQPSAVRLSFTEPLSGTLAHVAVIGPDDTSVGIGKPQVSGVDVVTMVRRLDIPGRYRVAYRVLAADGHLATGEFSFVVSEKAVSSARLQAAAPRPGWAAAPDAASVTPQSAVSWQWLAMCLAVAGLLVSTAVSRAKARRRTSRTTT